MTPSDGRTPRDPEVEAVLAAVLTVLRPVVSDALEQAKRKTGKTPPRGTRRPHVPVEDEAEVDEVTRARARELLARHR